MGLDLVRFTLRICFLGFIIGKFKKKISDNERERGFVNAVFPRPAGSWTIGNDFLWEPGTQISKEIKEGDWVLFFGYKSSSGWKARLVLKIF
ncbi:MAG: hypothetical protein WCO84_05285 [bacterium]